MKAPPVMESITRPAACVRPLAFSGVQKLNISQQAAPGSKVGKCYSKLSIFVCVVGASIARGCFLPCARCHRPGSAPPCRAAGRARETTRRSSGENGALSRRSLNPPPMPLSHSRNSPSYIASSP
jgi:hypothetical protein